MLKKKRKKTETLRHNAVYIFMSTESTTIRLTQFVATCTRSLREDNIFSGLYASVHKQGRGRDRTHTNKLIADKKKKIVDELKLNINEEN